MEESARKRAKTPSVCVIYKHWAVGKLPPVKGPLDRDIEEQSCFACGIFYNLQRAHIVPICLGGHNTVENIHLLCASCHSRSEGNEKYWIWLAYMRKNEWKTKYEWAIKILEMNGVDIEQERSRVENLSWRECLMHIADLLRANGINVNIPEIEFENL